MEFLLFIPKVVLGTILVASEICGDGVRYLDKKQQDTKNKRTEQCVYYNPS